MVRGWFEFNKLKITLQTYNIKPLIVLLCVTQLTSLKVICRLSAIYSYVRDGGQICCNWSRLKPGLSKYHAADKHDTQLSHFKLTLGQPALL